MYLLCQTCYWFIFLSPIYVSSSEAGRTNAQLFIIIVYVWLPLWLVSTHDILKVTYLEFHLQNNGFLLNETCGLNSFFLRVCLETFVCHDPGSIHFFLFFSYSCTHQYMHAHANTQTIASEKNYWKNVNDEKSKLEEEKQKAQYLGV